MRKLYLLLLVGAAACMRQPADYFVLRGSVPGAMDSTKVTLKTSGGWEKELDTAYIIGGRFELHGKTNAPTLCKLTLDNSEYLQRSGKSMEAARQYEIGFFVENGKLTFTTPHIDSLPQAFYLYDIRKEKNYILRGSTAQDAYYRYQQQTIPLRYGLQALRKQSYSNPDYPRLRETMEATLDSTAKAFIRNNSNLAANLYIAETLKKKPFTYDQAYLDELEGLFASYQDSCAALKDFRQYLHNASRLVQGTPLQDCQVVNAQGKSVSLLAQLNRKGYTLIDFWASWCIPCRIGLIFLREDLYKKYGETVRFISLSIDQKEADWQKALKEENSPWLQLRSLPEQTKVLTEQYDIFGVPTLFLIDSEGRIVFSCSDCTDLSFELNRIKNSKS